MAVEQTVLLVEANVLTAREDPTPAIAEPIFEVGTEDQMRIAAAVGPPAPA